MPFKFIKLVREQAYLIIESMGFESFDDLILDTFALRFKYIFLYLLGLSITLSISIWEALLQYSENTDMFIDTHLYSPSKGIWLLITITIINLGLGLALARNKKAKIDGYKFSKAFYRLGLQILFIFFLYNLTTTYTDINVVYAVHTFLWVFTLSTFWSAWNNGKDLDLITEDQHELVTGLLDIRKIITKFKGKGK